jgi:hypothetical protein
MEIERVKSELSSTVLDREHAISKLEKTERYDSSYLFRDRDRAAELAAKSLSEGLFKELMFQPELHKKIS